MSYSTDPTESVRKLLAPYEQRIEQLEKACRVMYRLNERNQHDFKEWLTELGVLEERSEKS